MIVITIGMKVYPEKRKEFLQTVRALIDSIRNEKGCISYRLYQDIENENDLILVDEWETQEDLDNHLQSDCFGVLIGAMSLLSEPPEIKFNAVSHKAGMEAIRATRRQIINRSNDKL